MATQQEIEDGIRKLYAINPKDPRLSTLKKARQDLIDSGGGAPAEGKGFFEDPGGYLSATYNNFTDLDQWKHAFTETPEAKAVMNPGQSIPDLARSMGNFVSLGATDRARSLMYGTDIADEVKQTDEASSRLGSIDEAFNLGTAALQPSAAGKYLPQGAGMVKSALAHSGEQALMSGTQAAMQGENILPAMGVGGAFGGGGSVAADAVGSVANIFSKRAQPQYASEDALQDAAKAASLKLNTKAGQKKGDEVITRNALVDQVRLAETKGPNAFGQLSDRLEGAGRDPRFPREVYEGISKLGTPVPSPIKRGLANIMDFGGGLGKLGAMKVSPLLPGGAAILRTMADLGSNLDTKTLRAVKAKLLEGSGTPGSPAMSPEMKEELRNYLAKMSGGGSRAKREPTDIGTIRRPANAL